MRNGFFNAQSKLEVHLIANCQTFMASTFGHIGLDELNYIRKIAKRYYKQNEPTPESQKIVLRDSSFCGGKSEHVVEVWPNPQFFEGKTKS